MLSLCGVTIAISYVRSLVWSPLLPHYIGSIKSLELPLIPSPTQNFIIIANFCSMYFKDLKFKSSSMQIHSCLAEIRQVFGTKI